jgi:hypothetical protein
MFVAMFLKLEAPLRPAPHLRDATPLDFLQLTFNPVLSTNNNDPVGNGRNVCLSIVHVRCYIMGSK